MKRLVLLRHAKSSWKDSTLPDHDRPLGKRGERDAPFMAKIVEQKKIKIDRVITSTAVRAVMTAKEFSKRLDLPKDRIDRRRELYLAEMNDLMREINSISEVLNTVMLVGHNPGFTWLANYLANEAIENIPTCGIAAIEFQVNTWAEIAGGTGDLLFFEYPKLYFKDADD